MSKIVATIEGMSEIKLAAKSPTEQRILSYLIANASDVLAAKINGGKKNLADALDYANSEARKLARGASSLCVDDKTVFGWIIHFFEEDSILPKQGKPQTKGPAAVKKRPQKATQPQKTGAFIPDMFEGVEL